MVASVLPGKLNLAALRPSQIVCNLQRQSKVCIQARALVYIEAHLYTFTP